MPSTQPPNHQTAKPLNVMVLAGGPDREREVSLVSGRQVAAALESRGHAVRLRDIGPDDLGALDAFDAWPGEALFLAMHGPWGEGGGLQRLLDERGLPYFGCDAHAAALCMDKARTKERLIEHGLPTPPFEVVDADQPMSLAAPVVLKPLCEGSSIGVAICRDQADADQRKRELTHQYGPLLVESFIDGLELTVGVIGGMDAQTGEVRDRPLPPVQIVAPDGFYDYDAKYVRDDTGYRFDIPLPQAVLDRVGNLAVEAHEVCGCRHLSRVDFMVDRDHQPWILEINTIPGFTTHSLVPKAAAHAGIDWPSLVDRLVRLAQRSPAEQNRVNV